MLVHEILDEKGAHVATIRPSATTAQAVERLRDKHIGALVVTGPDDGVLGLLAERDVVVGLANEGAALLRQSVAEVMRPRPPCCGPDDHVKEIMETMTMRRVRHLPVVEGGRLIGLISIGDVLKNRLDEMSLETNILRDAYIASH